MKAMPITSQTILPMRVLVAVAKSGKWHWPDCSLIRGAKITKRSFSSPLDAERVFRYERRDACLTCTLRAHFYSLSAETDWPGKGS